MLGPCWQSACGDMWFVDCLWLRFFHREHREGFLPPGVAWWKLQQPSSGQWHRVPCDLQGLGTGVEQKCRNLTDRSVRFAMLPLPLLSRHATSLYFHRNVEMFKSFFKTPLDFALFKLEFVGVSANSVFWVGLELACWVHVVGRLELPLSSLWRESLVQRISRLS